MKFADLVIKWYHKNKRDLPWRQTFDPYKIWISEVILQQTRVDQGLDYYNRFIIKFPEFRNLRYAKPEEVLNIVQGIGYYKRFLNILLAVDQIFEEYNGNFPDNFETLQKLKGVGTYTAAAIASFAFNEPVPVVDGNVYRVLSRYYADDTPIDTGKGKKFFFDNANNLMDKEQPADFNQAIMELGALVCKPVSPNCRECPVSKQCEAFSKNIQELFPVKSKSIKKRRRYLYFLDLRYNNSMLLMKRQEEDIWKNMYCFPVIEQNKEQTQRDIVKTKEWKNFFSKIPDYNIVKVSRIRHVLTHQILETTFFNIHINSKFDFEGAGLIDVTIKKLGDYPLPRLIEKYLENEKEMK